MIIPGSIIQKESAFPCHKETLRSISSQNKSHKMDGESDHLLSSTVSSILSCPTHTRGGRTPHHGVSHQPALPGVPEWGTSRGNYSSPGVLEAAPRQQRSEFTLASASRELSLQPPLQLSSAPRSDVAGRLSGVRNACRGRL